MIRLKQPVITNAKGEPIVLTREERHLAEYLQREFNEKFKNSLGYQVSITTLTTIAEENHRAEILRSLSRGIYADRGGARRLEQQSRHLSFVRAG